MYFNILSWYSIILCLLLFVIKECVGPRVCTAKNGCYNGTFMFSYPSVDPFDAFLGIPYANKPQRFEPAVIYRKSKEHVANKKGRDCLQKDYLSADHGISGGEDCLYLNVYRKEPKSDKLLPVMVYIFGDGFFSGTSSANFVGPEYIMDTEIWLDVILVTFNYRLGPFGFMGTSDGVIPGNLGLKDQVVALQWVYENIEFFGGNKFKVTLVGHGAGAVAAHLHVLSPISNNFHAIIAMSGTANSAYAIEVLPDNICRLTALHLNVSFWASIKTTKLLEELRKVEPIDLLNVADALKYWDVDDLATYRPMVEKPSPTAFLTENPTDLLRSGNYRPVPMMFGRVPNEGGIRAVAIMESDILRKSFNDQFLYLFFNLLEFPITFSNSQRKDKTYEVLDEYFVGEKVLDNITRQGFVDLITDRVFYHPLYSAMKLYVRHVNVTKYPVYMYNFNYLGPYTYANVYAGHEPKIDYGIIHGDDLLYLFRSPILFSNFHKDSVDITVVKEFVLDFMHFVHNHAPKRASSMRPCDRHAFNERPNQICDYEEYFLNRKGHLGVRIVDTFDTRRMSFWDRILEVNYDDDD